MPNPTVITDAELSGLLKNVYAQFREKVQNQVTPLLAQLQKARAGGPRNMRWGGNNVFFDVVVGRASGATFSPGGYFPPEGAGRMLHPHQIPTAYAWQAIRRSGARVIFSTDWPVIPVDVMPTIQAAVAPLSMPAPWTDQRQTLLDTLESYTAGNAWVEFNEARKGRLAPGMMADVAVLSHDLEAMDPARLTEASAVLTVCDGRITWQG